MKWNDIFEPALVLLIHFCMMTPPVDHCLLHVCMLSSFFGCLAFFYVDELVLFRVSSIVNKRSLVQSLRIL